MIVSLSWKIRGLRLCSQARSLERTRQWPIRDPDADNNAGCCAGSKSASTIISCVPSTRTNCWRGAHPDPQAALYDHLRDNVQNSIEMAILDALTGLP